jgi:hypothetical protein
MPFQKGKSGNPGGRPKGYADLTEAARRHSKDALRTLVNALNDEKLCVQAAVALLDRGYGKPAQAHTGEGGQGPIHILVSTGVDRTAREDHSG